MLKIIYLSGGQQFFRISPGIKALYDRDRRLVHLLAGKAKFGIGEAISADLSTEQVTGAHLTEAFGQGVSLVSLLMLPVKMKMLTFHIDFLKKVYSIKNCRFDIENGYKKKLIMRFCICN